MTTGAVTYTSLVADMKAYPQQNSSTAIRYHAQIPRLIQKAISRLGQEAKTLINRVPIQDEMITGNAVLAKPAYWRNTVSFVIAYGVSFANTKTLEQHTKEFIQTYWSTPRDTATPKYYGDYDQDHWLFGPTPSAPFPVEYVVDLQAAPLDETTETNFWTEKAPNLLVDACMLEAAIFLNPDSPGKIQTRQGVYDRTLQAVLGEKAQQQSDRTQRSKA